MRKDPKGLKRRDFFKTGAMAAVAAGMGLKAGAQAPSNDGSVPGAKVGLGTKDKILNEHPAMRYRELPGTGLYFSAISLGGINLNRRLAFHCIDHGVNLVHMSRSYNGGRAIEELAAVLKTHRDRVYIALKDSFRDIDEPLEKMGVDYVDFIMFNRHSEDDVRDPRLRERFEKWREQGKVRFAGLTSHRDVKNCMRAGIESGFMKLLMPVLNQPGFEDMQEEMRDARAKGIGVMAMKTMKGIKDRQMELAFLKKVLRDPAVTTVNKGYGNFERFDDYLKATGETLSAREDRRLYRYAQANRSDNCMMCGACSGDCPNDIDIPCALRCKDYYLDQLGDRNLAEETYRSIPKPRRFELACEDCGKCEEACPNGIAVRRKLSEAAMVLG